MGLIHKTVNDRKAIDAFISAHSYEAQKGLLIKNVPKHPVHKRPNRGNAGAYFHFEKLKVIEAHVSEIAPFQETKTHRHTCDALFYVISGRGYSVIQDEGTAEEKIEWKKGDLFFTPRLSWHKHVNLEKTKPARYLEITTMPLAKDFGNWRIETVKEKKNAI